MTTTLSPVRPFARPSTFMAKLYCDGSRSDACNRHGTSRGGLGPAPPRGRHPRHLPPACCHPPALSPRWGPANPGTHVGCPTLRFMPFPGPAGEVGPASVLTQDFSEPWLQGSGRITQIVPGLRCCPQSPCYGVLVKKSRTQVPWGWSGDRIWSHGVRGRGVLVLHYMNFRQPLRDPIPCLIPSPGPHCPQVRQGETPGGSRTQALCNRGPPGVTAWSHRASACCTAH